MEWINVLSAYQRKEKKKVERSMACPYNQGHNSSEILGDMMFSSRMCSACVLLRTQHRWLNSGRPYASIKGGVWQGYSTWQGLFLYLPAQQEDTSWFMKLAIAWVSIALFDHPSGKINKSVNNYSYLSLISHFQTCIHCLSSYHCASPGKVWLCLLIGN